MSFTVKPINQWYDWQTDKSLYRNTLY